MSTRDNPWWDPGDYAARRPALLARAALLRRMRDWFHGAGFVEVETPALQVAAGMEVHVAPFGTTLSEPDGRSRALRLHSSPEFAMKKLLVAGEPRLFQFARVFRNGERSATHHPEFTLLEWYRAGAGWRDLVPDCEALLALAGPELRWNGRRVPVAAPFERLSVAAAFRDRLGLDVLAADTTRLAAACRAEGLEPGGEDGWEDLFFRLFLNRIEPHLGLARPTVLHGWPARMAALARIDPAEPRTAERFEIYVGGLELANAFGELTDAAEQRRRFEAAARERRALHGDDLPIDEDFLSALEHGMPSSAGIALGFDRLAMLAVGAARIEDVLWAPVAAAREEEAQGEGRMSEAGRFFWNELMTPDVEGAKAFYGRLFGWEAHTAEMPGGGDYTEFKRGGMPVGGAMAPPEPGIPPHWMPYVRVEDADAVAAAAAEAGGKVCQAAFDVPQVGRIAVLQDPAGAVFAVIAPAPELLAGG